MINNSFACSITSSQVAGSFISSWARIHSTISFSTVGLNICHLELTNLSGDLLVISKSNQSKQTLKLQAAS
ncbi:hypothetical protein MGS_01250 [Candida albicans P78042]|nr:hypothetical protein MG7_01253 [Candida albicans P34048]KHC84678.1 hypothetical protein MGS_01250 [Candida albicans P78042]